MTTKVTASGGSRHQQTTFDKARPAIFGAIIIVPVHQPRDTTVETGPRGPKR